MSTDMDDYVKKVKAKSLTKQLAAKAYYDLHGKLPLITKDNENSNSCLHLKCSECPMKGPDQCGWIVYDVVPEPYDRA
jgi:hypothetical protein